MTDQPTHGDLRDLLIRLDERMQAGFDAVHLSIGKPSDDGKGGSGLWGEVRRTQVDLAALTALRNQGVGLIAAVGLFGVLIVLGVKQWIAQVMS